MSKKKMVPIPLDESVYKKLQTLAAKMGLNVTSAIRFFIMEKINEK